MQAAIAERGGISKVRCLHARRDPEVEIDIALSRELDQEEPSGRYVLAFKPEDKGARGLRVWREQARARKRLREAVVSHRSMPAN